MARLSELTHATKRFKVTHTCRIQFSLILEMLPRQFFFRIIAYFMAKRSEIFQASEIYFYQNELPFYRNFVNIVNIKHRWKFCVFVLKKIAD